MTNNDKLLYLEKRKAKTVNLARKHGVFNAIEYYFFRVVSWSTDTKVSRHNKIANSVNLKGYQYEKDNHGIDRGCCFNIGENAFSMSAKFANSTEVGVIKVLWNNEEVLTVNCKRLESYFNFQLQADLPNVSTLKLKKEWVSCVQQFHQVCENAIQEEEREIEEEKLQKLAEDFDLGDFE